MQSLGGSLMMLQLLGAPGSLGRCAAACQGVLLQCLSSLQPSQQQHSNIQAAAAVCHQQHQLPCSLPHLQQHHLLLLRHYIPPARAAHRSLRPPASESDGSSDSEQEFHPPSRRPRQQQQRNRQQQQQQQQQQFSRQQPYHRQQSRLGDGADEEAAAFQQQWRQQWQQQHHRNSAGRSTSSRRDTYNDRRDTYNDSPSRSASSRRDTYNDSPRRSHQQQQQPGRTKGGSKSAVFDAAGITRSITAAASLQELQQLLQQQKEQLQQIHVCAAYKAVVRLSVGLRDRTAAGGKQAVQDVSSSSSSRQGEPVDGSVALDVLRQLSARMQQQIRVARPWDLAQAAWACSKLQYRDEQLLQAVGQQAQRKAAILTPQDICQLASAYARLSYPHPQLTQLLSSQATAKASDFEPWGLVHTAWALQVCGQDVGGLLQVALPLLREQGRVQQLKELDMSTLLWLLAGHSLHDDQLLQLATAHLVDTIATYSPATASNVLMACAALGFITPQLSAAAGASVLSGLQQQQKQQTRYGPKQVAQAAFALTKLQACEQQLLDATAAAFGREAQAYSPPLLSMLVWVCVLARQQLPEGFLQQLLACCRSKLSAFSGDQLASLLRGILAMPAHQQQDYGGGSSSGSTVLPLLAEAQTLLPQKLSDISTAVLTELIKSLATHCSSASLSAQQQQHSAAQHSIAAAAPATGGADTTATSNISTAGVERVQGMLQDCMVEWSTAQRLSQLTVAQAAAVQGLLEGCESLQGLAAVARQVCDNVRQAPAEKQQGQQGAALPAGGAADAEPAGKQAGGASSSWVDSFVASTE